MLYDDQYYLIHRFHLFQVIVISISKIKYLFDLLKYQLTFATFNISLCSCSLIWIASSVDDGNFL